MRKNKERVIIILKNLEMSVVYDDQIYRLHCVFLS